MKDKMVDTNTKIETQLRLESEHIKRMFLQTKTDSEKLLEKLTGDDDKVVLYYTENHVYNLNM